MANTAKTAIVTGASQGIGAGLVDAFLQRGYSVVANSRHITKTNPFAYLVKASDNVEGVDPSVFEGIKSAIRADRASFTFDFLKNFYNYDVTADRILPAAATARRQAKMIKHAKLAEIPGGPHGLCWTHGDRVNAELLPFVE
jgi:NAD(P)-dependent dehydrogenase (short-subunit alcohol dehydrogenase family)